MIIALGSLNSVGIPFSTEYADTEEDVEPSEIIRLRARSLIIRMPPRSQIVKTRNRSSIIKLGER